MAFTFGVKRADEPEYVPGEDGGEFKPYIRYFTKDSTTRLRFLEELDDWTQVWMHFNSTKNRGYPCTGDRKSCPGCNSENEREAKASKKYLTNARFYDEESGEYKYTNLYQIPGSLINSFARKNEKHKGTIRDRDYEVIRVDASNQTTYELDECDKSDYDFSEGTEYYLDHQEMLQDVFREVWGGLPGDDDYTGDDEVYGIERPKAKKEPKNFEEQVKKSKKNKGENTAPEYGAPTFSGATRDQFDVLTEWDRKVNEISVMDAEELIELHEVLDVDLPKKRTRKALAKSLIAGMSA